MNKNSLVIFFKKYIKGTSYKAPVFNSKLLICDLNGFSVYITTRSLKHLFDKKPAEEFHFILDNLTILIKDPEEIYKNKSEKHGDICFVRQIKDFYYICSLQKISSKELQVVTAFRLRDEDYIKNYTLLWNRGSGKPHRHVTDSLRESVNAPQ